MSLLHDYINTRNLQAFQRLLDGHAERGSSSASASSGGASGSYTGGGGKLWTRNGGVMNAGSGHICEVNARDWLGRTVLHLACNKVEHIEFARALLKHPSIDVNLPDTESLWTPLHRALYAANLPVALLLLQRPDIDTSLQDYEGYTAFDLYNSTVNGTKPAEGDVGAELYTWGANRNAALGVGDENDRTYPDHVAIASKEVQEALAKFNLTTRFSPIRVRQVQMSRLHTAVVTFEREGNLRLCGFGSGGRLGPAQHTQYSLNPLSSLNVEIVKVALGQDHTLALTRSGEVLSWGLNRFSQLGYVVETAATANGRHSEEPIQSVPKRVFGVLRKEVVLGVAASKNASACWTEDTVYTWGTNTGQLGYDKNAQPVQILPRPVTKFTNTVIDLAMSDTVLAGLLVTRHVECIWNDRQYRISFPMHAFPTGIEPYRPPQSIKDSRISKVACCDDTFAALSLNGEVFTFAPPKSNGETGSGEGKAFAPQRVWALRKKFSAVKDVALGSEGSIIICTESGHVFIRNRNTKNSSAKAFRFERVPYLQRVKQVCANGTGAFSALKVEYQPKPIDVTGNSIAQDLKRVQPYLQFYQDNRIKDELSPTGTGSGGKPGVGWTGDLSSSLQVGEDEPEDEEIEGDICSVLELCRVLAVVQQMRKIGSGNINYDDARLPHDADTMVHLRSGEPFPVHRAILAARSKPFVKVLSGSGTITDPKSNISIQLMAAKPRNSPGIKKISRLSISRCHSLSVLILFHYLYADELLAIWDRRIGTHVQTQLSALGAEVTQVKTELQALARLLGLAPLTQALEAPSRRVPSPSLANDMRSLFEDVQKESLKTSSIAPDVILQFTDKDVYTHSVVLRARSPLFTSFFDLEDWTAKRWGADGLVRVNMKHLESHAMDFVLKFMCCGMDEEMFRHLDFINSTEELIPFMFEVLAGANELHLDRLILLCSAVILQFTNFGNTCYILAEATHYRILPLIEKLQEYISVNLESFLECRMLDEISYPLVKQLAQFTRQQQKEKSSFTRSDAHVDSVLAKHAEWLAVQDIPLPTLKHTVSKDYRRDMMSSKLSQPTPLRPSSSKTAITGGQSALPDISSLRTLRRPPSGDDIFLMDDPETPGPSKSISLPSSSDSAQPVAVWKAHGAPRVDMKAVMAEAASQKKPTLTRLPYPPSVSPGQPRAGSSKTATSTMDALNSLMAGKGSPKPSTSPAWRTSIMSNPPPDSSMLGSQTSSPSLVAAASSSKEGSSKTGSRQSTKVPLIGPPASPSPATPKWTASTAPAPGMGPVITPTRQTPTKGSMPHNRNAVGGKAWTMQSPQPVVEPSPTITRGMSFVAIQHLQQEQVTPVKDKRSLREIQEEEHALQEEADFMKWWTAEEERVRQEALTLAQFENALNNNSNRRPGPAPARRSRPPKQKQKQQADTPVPSSAGNSGSQPQQSSRKSEPKDQSGKSGSGNTHPPRKPHRPRPKEASTS